MTTIKPDKTTVFLNVALAFALFGLVAIKAIDWKACMGGLTLLFVPSMFMKKKKAIEGYDEESDGSDDEPTAPDVVKVVKIAEKEPSDEPSPPMPMIVTPIVEKKE